MNVMVDGSVRHVDRSDVCDVSSVECFRAVFPLNVTDITQPGTSPAASAGLASLQMSM